LQLGIWLIGNIKNTLKKHEIIISKKLKQILSFFKKPGLQRELKMIGYILFGMRLAAIVPGVQVYIVKNIN
jgi:hypothetical protein